MPQAKGRGARVSKRVVDGSREVLLRASLLDAVTGAIIDDVIDIGRCCPGKILKRQKAKQNQTETSERKGNQRRGPEGTRRTRG